MMKIRSFLNQIGLFNKKIRNKQSIEHALISYTDQDDEEKSSAHLNYLQGLAHDEENRLNLIETKSSQLVSQTGLIFSLLSLFVPILLDKLTGFSILMKALLLLLLIISLFFYILTINNALKNYNVKQFNYSTPSPSNVQHFHGKTIAEFNSEVIRDILYSLHINKELNNKKATYLIQSYTTFRIANSLAGIIVLLLCATLLFSENSYDKKVPHDNLNKIDMNHDCPNIKR